jgi:S-adenosylmethionine:tRNA ribosyltransferase-isomerase
LTPGGDALRLTSAYAYDLPPSAIATRPADPPDGARLLVVRAGAEPAHATFSEFPDLLQYGDVLVVNETRVIRARLLGTRAGGGAAEVLLLRPSDRTRYDGAAGRWLALVRPGRRLRAGATVRFGEEGVARVVAVHADGVREIELACTNSLEALLERHGEMPLPPYVGGGDEARAARYQTIFARVPGSVAAPTASLHFTQRVLERVRARGVTVAPIVLDIGLGTFRPIDAARIDDHAMHAETYEIPEATAAAIAAAKAEGRRVIAAGTTAVRALEGSAAEHGSVRRGSGETSLFITPGFQWRVVDGLLTNFHLPQSTLLVLVCAFAGYETVMNAYRTAVAAGYRFYSFGDAMFALRA